MNIGHPSLADADLPPPDPSGDPDRDQPAAGCGGDDSGDPAWLKRRAALLERLAERGVEVAGELPALAKAQSRLAEAVTSCLHQAPQAGIAALGELAVTLHRGNVDFALMYERISRSVRRCIAMREQAPPRTSAAAARPDTGGAAPRSSTSGGSAKPAAAASRDPIAELAKDMAAGRTGELDAEQLLSDLYDRPEDPTGMADLGLDRPMAELVAEICRDFGVDGQEWAARLGLADETKAASEPGPRRKHLPGRRRHRQTGKGSVDPAAEGPPPAPAATGQVRAPDPPVADPPRGRVDFGQRAANRRERRAAAKLTRKPPAAGSRAAPIAANDRSPDSGCGPP